MQPEDSPSEKYLRRNDPFRQVDPEELELAYRLQNLQPGDKKELLGRLIAHYAAGIQRWVEVLLVVRGMYKPTPEEVLSVTRQTFVKALQQVDQFHGQASVNLWLFRIAYKFVIENKQRRRLEMALHRADGSAMESLLLSDPFAAYWESVDRLPDKYRLPLILRYLFDLDVSDISYIVSLRGKDVQKRLSTARHELLVNPALAHYRKQIQERLDGLLDNNLEAINHLEGHLAECRDCKEYTHKLSGLEKKLTSGLKVRWSLHVISPNELEALTEAVDKETKHPQTRWKTRLPLRQVAWITGLLLTFIGLAVIFIRMTPVEREFPSLKLPTTPNLPPITSIEPRAIPSPNDGESAIVPQFIEPDFSSDGNWGVFASIKRDPTTQAILLPTIELYDRETNTFQVISESTATISLPWIWWVLTPSISADGRWITYVSSTDDSNISGHPCESSDYRSCLDIFLYDRQTGTTRRITHGLNGEAADGDSFSPTISGNGQWVAFWSAASNMLAGVNNACQQGETVVTCLYVYLFNRESGTIERIPFRTIPGVSVYGVDRISLSFDGRYVGFTVSSQVQAGNPSIDNQLTFNAPGNSINLTANDISTLGIEHSTEAVVYDRETGGYELENQAQDGSPGNGASSSPVLSADGRYVAFVSSSMNLVAGDTNAYSDVFLRDRENGKIELVSVTLDGRQGNGNSGLIFWDRGYYSLNISGDGRYIVFESSATNLGQKLNSECNQFASSVCNILYVHDRQTGSTDWISAQPNGDFLFFPKISYEGRWITFMQSVYNCSSTQFLCSNVMLYDRQRGWMTNLTNYEAGTANLPWSYSGSLALPWETWESKALAFSPNDNLLALGGIDSKVRIWQITHFGQLINQDEPIITLETGGSEYFTAITFTPDSEWLAAGTMSGAVYIWNLPEGSLLYDLSGQSDPIKDMVFSQDGSRLVITSLNEAWIWQKGENQLIKVNSISYGPTAAYGIAISPLGTIIASARGDGTVWLQSMPNGEVFARLGGHRIAVRDIAFSPDGTLLATHTLDGTINLWQIGETEAGAFSVTPINTIQSNDYVGSIYFSPDNKYLASTGMVGEITLWSVPDGNVFTISSTVPNGMVDSLTFSKAGDKLAAVIQNEIAIWGIPLNQSSRYFVHSGQDTRIVSRTLLESSASDIPQIQLPASSGGDEHLNVYQASSTLPSLIVPMHLPENITFQDARVLSDGSIWLRYEASDSPSINATLNIFEQRVGNTSVPTMTIGANATVVSVRIETSTSWVPGEYVHGDWISSLVFTSTGGESLSGDVQDIWQWDNNSGSQRLRWLQNGLLIAVYYEVNRNWSPVLEGPSQENNTFRSSFILSQEDMLQIAQGMAPLLEVTMPELGLISYTVQPGDTCTSIANNFGSTIYLLTDENGLNQTCDIYAGQTMQVPISSYQHWEDIDMDCDGRLERFEILPLPNTNPSVAVLGIKLLRLDDYGLYQSNWQYTVTEGSSLRLSHPELFYPGTCEGFLSFDEMGGNNPGLKIYHLQNGNMQMLLNDPGSPMGLIAPNGIATTITTWRSSLDPVSGLCSTTTTIYDWDGQTFVLTSQETHEGEDCSTTLPSGQDHPVYMQNVTNVMD
jgi:WD40 repeat protein/DNA-directed RNA polymerase specialized sigma24 family protein